MCACEINNGTSVSTEEEWASLVESESNRLDGYTSCQVPRGMR